MATPIKKIAPQTHPLVILEDKNSQCISMLATVKLPQYLELISGAYQDKGGLEGQRAPITTKTGQKIRGRLVSDLKKGAVIPPIVIGAVCPPRLIKKLQNCKNSESLVKELKAESVDLSIIDGMQRTTALVEAKLGVSAPHIRIELWLAKKVDSLIYRMLVLNTGQVPWDLKRQLDTLYRPIIKRIETDVPDIRIIGLNETFRRSQAGEYRSTRIIELFLAFTSRSVDIDIKERVAEEFAKIDITEATSNSDFMPLFTETIKLMIQVDRMFDRSPKNSVAEESKIKSGRDIFTSGPGAIGFVAAIAEKLLDAPGFDYDIVDAKKSLTQIKASIAKLDAHLKVKNDQQVAQFLDLETLNQVLFVKMSRIGEYQRNLYKRAFTVLVEKSSQIIKQDSMSPCWQSR